MIKAQILSNASRIRRYLDQKGEATVSDLKGQLKLPEQEVCLALGWMACENKVILRLDEQELNAIVFY